MPETKDTPTIPEWLLEAGRELVKKQSDENCHVLIGEYDIAEAVMRHLPTDWILAAAEEIADWVGNNHSAFHGEHEPTNQIAAIIARHRKGGE